MALIIPLELRAYDLFQGRGISDEVVSVHRNSPWKQWMKESRLCLCLLNWKAVWLSWFENEARMNNKAPVRPGCGAENSNLQKDAFQNLDVITARISQLSKEALVEQAVNDDCIAGVKVSNFPWKS